jgi:hypothetical protein
MKLLLVGERCINSPIHPGDWPGSQFCIQSRSFADQGETIDTFAASIVSSNHLRGLFKS